MSFSPVSGHLAPASDDSAPRRALLLDPGLNLTLRPMRYPQFFAMYTDAIKNTWTVDEVDFSTDVADLQRRMSAADRHLVERLVAFSPPATRSSPTTWC